MANVFGDTGLALITPLQSIWVKLVEGLPNLLGAVIVLIVGVFVALVLGHATRIILEKAGLNVWIKKAKLSKAIGGTNVTLVLGEIVKWYIVVLFLAPAANLVNLGSLSTLLVSFALWLPKLIGAVVLFLLGLAGIHYLYLFINEHTRMKGMRMANKVLVTILTIILSIFALDQIGVETTLLQNIVYILFGALAVGIALSLGIGLGLGLKKESEALISEIKKNF